MAWSKLSRQERGYGKEWTRVRKVVLERDAGLCQVCKRAGRYTPGNTVDHIISKAKAAAMKWSQARIDDPMNLQTICEPCHAVKTEAEQGKTKRAAVTIGLDGWPTEG